MLMILLISTQLGSLIWCCANTASDYLKAAQVIFHPEWSLENRLRSRLSIAGLIDLPVLLPISLYLSDLPASF